MKILVTGGFGNIGIAVLEECLRRGHSVTVFDLESKRSRRLSRKYSRDGLRTVFGDLRNPVDVGKAVAHQDAIIHLAAILPPLSDASPKLCREVNVSGVENLLAAIRGEQSGAVFVEVSSASVMGPTQDRNTPLSPEDPLVATDMYSTTKIEAERLVEGSGIRYCILRLAAVLPTNLNLSYLLNMVRVMFDMPLEARCEIVLDIDVATALVGAAENLHAGGETAGLRGFIAGGRDHGCRLTNGAMLRAVFARLGLPFPGQALFEDQTRGYYLDWYNTEETQRILHYQNHSFEDWKTIVASKLGGFTPVVRAFKAPILAWLERQSPRHGGGRFD